MIVADLKPKPLSEATNVVEVDTTRNESYHNPVIEPPFPIEDGQSITTTCFKFIDQFERDFARPTVRQLLEAGSLPPYIANHIETPAMIAFSLATVYFVFFASLALLWKISALSFAVIYIIIVHAVPLLWTFLRLSMTSIIIFLGTTTIITSIHFFLFSAVGAYHGTQSFNIARDANWASTSLRLQRDITDSIQELVGKVKTKMTFIVENLDQKYFMDSFFAFANYPIAGFKYLGHMKILQTIFWLPAVIWSATRLFVLCLRLVGRTAKLVSLVFQWMCRQTFFLLRGFFSLLFFRSKTSLGRVKTE